jgi:uncharacterized protein involved in tolerance to divalent cations
MIVEMIKKGLDDIVFVYTTCRDKASARAIALSIIEERLVVSADFWPIESIYPWHGVVQEVEQYMVVFTTQKCLSEKLVKFIGSIHPYDVPVIAECDTQISSGLYKLWVDKTLNGGAEYISEYDQKMKEQFAAENGYHPGKLK